MKPYTMLHPFSFFYFFFNSFLFELVVGYRGAKKRAMFQKPYGTVLFDAVCIPDQFDTFFLKKNRLKNETESAKKWRPR